MEIKNLNKNNITYVFLSGRKKRLETKNAGAKEFFYGYQYFKNLAISCTESNPRIDSLNIIEFNNSYDSLFDKFSRKISDLPFFTKKVMTKSNFKIFSKSTALFLTNQRVGFSMILYNILLRVTKKIKINVFIMGLFNKKTNYRIKTLFRSLYIGIFILSSTKLLFLSKGEYEYAVKTMPFWNKKFRFLPFAVDTDFWKYKKKKRLTNEILFIGNDGQRDYSFLIELAESLPEYKFTIVSNKISKEDLKSENIRLINGSWDNENYSDEFIHNLYTNASLTVLPVKNTLQPSGQSVALQSMSSGTPVIITNTQGFWEPNIFNDSENIFFVENNTIIEWKNKLESILKNYELLVNVAENARNTVVSNNNLDDFNKNLENLI